MTLGTEGLWLWSRTLGSRLHCLKAGGGTARLGPPTVPAIDLFIEVWFPKQKAYPGSI